MALSPNYGWAEPDNSSLVKNGAQDIRALGDAIDTSLWNVGFGQAGKNKVINGDFGIWQRGTSFSNPAQLTYQADRWTLAYYDAQPTTYAITQQSFTAGIAPVSGYEATFFGRSTITTVGSATIFRPFDQKIEDVRTFAGQTVTFSLWAKADSVRSFTMNFQQNFGTGGSGAVGGSGQVQTLSTSWQRFTWTFAIPSISGKTIGTGSNLEVIIQQACASGSVLDVWGVQLEYGSKATPFETATGTIQGELAACQRYFQRFGNSLANEMVGLGVVASNTGYVQVQHNVTLRTTPALTFSASGDFVISNGVSSPTSTFIGADVLGTKVSSISAAFGVVVTAGTACRLYRNGSASGSFIDFSAEL
jgi:hypothetical protein